MAALAEPRAIAREMIVTMEHRLTIRSSEGEVQ